MGSNGGQVEKRRPGIKMAEKGPKKFSRFMRHFPTTCCADTERRRRMEGLL